MRNRDQLVYKGGALGLGWMLLLGCGGGGGQTADESSTTVDNTTTDTDSTTMPPPESTSESTTATDSTTVADSSSSSGSESTTTAGECPNALPFNEDIGGAIGRAVAVGTNAGAGDHVEDLCGARVPDGATTTSVGSATTDGGFDTFSTTGFDPANTTTTGFDTFSTTGFDPVSTTTGFDTDGATTTTDSDGATTGESTGEEWIVQWTAPSAGTFRFDLDGSNYDTLLGIYDGCSGQSLDCNDDCFGLRSAVAVEVAAGQVIHAVIGGFGGRTGSFSLSITEDIVECSSSDTGFSDSGGK